MKELNAMECLEVSGGSACDYSTASEMSANIGVIVALGGMVGFYSGGPYMAAVGAAGLSAGATFYYGIYNAWTLGVDLTGFCSGYTG